LLIKRSRLECDVKVKSEDEEGFKPEPALIEADADCNFDHERRVVVWSSSWSDNGRVGTAIQVLPQVSERLEQDWIRWFGRPVVNETEFDDSMVLESSGMCSLLRLAGMLSR
jgi:hypothetical protein